MSQSKDTSFTDYLDVFTYEYILDRMLATIPDSLDKREGSIIWDALSPAAVELAKMYIELKTILINTYASTAVGQYLDLRVQERGMQRIPASAAVKLGTFVGADDLPASISIGSRFSTVSDTNPINYVVSEVYTEGGIEQAGKYKLVCEEVGTLGNSYTGNLLPISNVQDLRSAIMSDLLIPGRDIESDDDLYDRYINLINVSAFGGNVTQYREWVLGIDGVGAVQVYPVWNGGGTVKCSIIGSDFNPASQELIDVVQAELDPLLNQGEGLGLAPIGHTVTVGTATDFSVNVVVDVTAEAGYSAEQIKVLAEPILEEYMQSLRQKWGDLSAINTYSLGVYRANIIAAIISIPQVINVTNVRLNGVQADIVLTETAAVQQLPQLGTVTINV